MKTKERKLGLRNLKERGKMVLGIIGKKNHYHLLLWRERNNGGLKEKGGGGLTKENLREEEVLPMQREGEEREGTMLPCARNTGRLPEGGRKKETTLPKERC